MRRVEKIECGILFSNSSREVYAFYKNREDENNINKIFKNRISFKLIREKYESGKLDHSDKRRENRKQCKISHKKTI